MHNLHTHPGIIINTTDEQQHQPGEQYQLKQHPSPNGILPPTIEFIAPHTKHEPGNLMTPVSYCYPDPYFGSIVATYGAQAMVHPRMLGVQQASLPLPSDTFEEPVFVNAKQYHGILRRRQSRAKAESENKLVKCRKPYLHESRHLHAVRRARGCGGRFLNTKKDGSSQDEVSGDKNLFDSTHQDLKVNKADTEKELVAGQNSSSKTNLMTGKGIQLGNSAGSIQFGNMSPAGPGDTRSVSNGIYQNSNQGQAFRSSVFHSLSVGSADNGQSGVMVAKAGHHTAVATQ